MTTRNETLTRIFHQYQREHGGAPESPQVVAAWALANGLLTAPKFDPAAIIAEDMTRALREEYATDPATGRRYRRNHAVRITRNSVQLALWVSMDTAPRHHMLKAFQQRRAQIVSDCHQLKTDVDVYNSKHPEVDPIQLVLDFTKDVAEIEAAGDIAA